MPRGNGAVLTAYNERAAFDNTRRVWAALTTDPCRTVRELVDDLGLAHDTVIRAIRRLSDAGYIDYQPGATRARSVIVPFVIINKEERC